MRVAIALAVVVVLCSLSSASAFLPFNLLNNIEDANGKDHV